VEPDLDFTKSRLPEKAAGFLFGAPAAAIRDFDSCEIQEVPGLSRITEKDHENHERHEEARNEEVFSLLSTL
jgi:hypothetical protein